MFLKKKKKIDSLPFNIDGKKLPLQKDHVNLNKWKKFNSIWLKDAIANYIR